MVRNSVIQQQILVLDVSDALVVAVVALVAPLITSLESALQFPKNKLVNMSELDRLDSWWLIHTVR